MTETVRYTKIFAEDIAFGSATQNVELQGGEVVALSEMNLTYLHDSNNNVLYASSDATTDDTFNFNATDNRLFVPEIAGGTASGDDVRIKGTTHATAGFVTLNEDGGNVGIGIASPTSLLHLQGTGPEILVDESSTSDPKIAFALSSVDTFVMGIDNSDSDKFKLENGGVLGANNDFVLTSAGLIGLGIAAPEASLHVFTSDSSVAPQADADDLFIETSANTGLTIGSGTTSTGTIRFADSASANAGHVKLNHSTNNMIFGIANDDIMNISSNGVLIGTASDDSFASLYGLVLDHGVAGGIILTMKAAGSVTHGMTTHAETDTFAAFEMENVSAGGLRINGYTEATSGVYVRAYGDTENTVSTAAGDGQIVLDAATKSGTTVTALGATTNVLSVENNGSAVFLVKGNGDLYNDGSATLNTFDDYDDTKLLKAVKGAMDVNYRQRLGEWIGEHTAILERGGIIVPCESGRYFISQNGFRGLLVDCIGQLDARLRALESAGA